MTFDEIEKALDAGKLEVETPDGRWVRARRRLRTAYGHGGYMRLEMLIDGHIEFSISTDTPDLGDVRIAA